jgi:hypothetical protein
VIGQPTAYLEPVAPAWADPSPWRRKLEGAAVKRGFLVHWWRTDSPGFAGLRVEVRDRSLQVVKRAGLTKLASSFDEGRVAEGVAAWLMDPLPPPE